jgi:outer membrane protein OmpA-like peptidoglycan-associated protein
MAKHAAKCKIPEAEECPEWIFTFADLVMLMMGFFVILWVLKPPEGKQTNGEADKKWLDTVAEIRKPFGWVPDPLSSDPVDKNALKRPDPSTGKGGQTTEPPDGARGTEPLVTNIRPGTHVAVGGRLGFALGDATLNPETLRVADEVFGLIKGHRNIIQVKGHAGLDDFPDGTPSQRFMDLSLRRAQAIADYFLSKGCSPDVLRVQGCSTFEPVVQKVYDAGAQAFNRRVEIEVTNVTVPERQAAGGTNGAEAIRAEPAKPNTPAAVEPPKGKSGH